MFCRVCSGECWLLLVSSSGVKLIFLLLLVVMLVLSVCVISCVFR